jgi:hypothetical protein
MNLEEVGGVLRTLHPVYKDWVGEPPAGGDDLEYLKRLATYYVAMLLLRRNESVKEVIDAELSTSEVLRVYPELEERLDDDGLLVVDEDLSLMDAGIDYKNHILHYHQFFRNGYHGSPSSDFLWRFRQYHSESNARNKFRIAIDHRRLMPKEAYAEMIQLSQWFGPEFGQDKLDDPEVVGLAVVKRDEPDLFRLLGSADSSLDRTEFFWKRKDRVKTLEIEEISTGGHLFDSYHLNKYVHSERDMRDQRLRHFDGALKCYTKDRYAKRLSLYMPHEERCLRKIKLFRIDGNVDPERWLDMIGHFYWGNEMVLEYFDSEKYHRIYDEKIELHRESRNRSS